MFLSKWLKKLIADAWKFKILWRRQVVIDNGNRKDRGISETIKLFL